MKAATLAARALVCAMALAHVARTPAQPPHAPPPRAPEMAAGWRGPPPAGASAPRGNLRNDIENNARWNGNAARPRPPPPR